MWRCADVDSLSPSSAVVVAAHDFIARVFDVIRERCPGPEDEDETAGFLRWVEDPQLGQTPYRHFVQLPELWTALKQCALREVAGLHESAEYGTLVEALRADPVIGSRLGTESVGGAGLGGGAWSPEGMIVTLVSELVDHGPKPDAATMSETIARWDAYMRRAEEVVTVLAPLAEFTSDIAPIQLTDDLAIVELGSDEIAALLTFGPWAVGGFGGNIPRGHSGFPPSVMLSRVFALRADYRAPVFYNNTVGPEVDETVRKRSEIEERISAGLRALRLYKRGRVGLHSIVNVVTGIDGRLSPILALLVSSALRGRVLPYSVEEQEWRSLEDFARAFLDSEGTSDLLSVAARRFGYASDRSRPDDEVVDLMIAAESIFASDTGATADVTFRLSTRAALFADGDSPYRHQLLTFMKKAYRARSGIVHAGRPERSSLRNLRGDAVSVEQLADDLENVVRDALKKAVRMVSSGEAFPPNWDQLLLD